jgi:hypothetical protein
MADMQAAAQRKATKMKFKGKYAGPDKFKGVIPEGYKGKAKGKYFGKDSRKGANVERTKPSVPPSTKLANPGKIIDDPEYKLDSRYQELMDKVKAASGT